MSEAGKPVDTLFKIRRPSDGLYSDGGIKPSFSERGKVWRNIGFLKNHLNQVRDLKVYSGCDLIKLETYEVESGCRPLDDVIAEQEAKHKAKEEKYQRQIREFKEREERQELTRLKNKYER